MTQTPKPLTEAHCLTTNDHYRTTILTVCQTCLQKAQSRQEFQTMMDTIELIINALSDYPKTDENFISGVANALDAVGWWNQ